MAAIVYPLAKANGNEARQYFYLTKDAFHCRHIYVTDEFWSAGKSRQTAVRMTSFVRPLFCGPTNCIIFLLNGTLFMTQFSCSFNLYINSSPF